MHSLSIWALLNGRYSCGKKKKEEIITHLVQTTMIISCSCIFQCLREVCQTDVSLWHNDSQKRLRWNTILTSLVCFSYLHNTGMQTKTHIYNWLTRSVVLSSFLVIQQFWSWSLFLQNKKQTCQLNQYPSVVEHKLSWIRREMNGSSTVTKRKWRSETDKSTAAV